MWRRTLLLFMIGLLLVGIILYLVDPSRVWIEIQRVSIKFILLLLLIQIMIMINSAVKWWVILMNSRVSFRNLMPAVLVGYLINNVTPIGLAGGEPIRAYILSRIEKIRLSTAVSSVMIDLLLEIIPIFMLIAISISLILLGGESEIIAILLGIIAISLLCLVIIYVRISRDKNLIYILTSALINLLARIPFLREYSKSKKSDIAGISDRFKSAIQKQMMDTKIMSLAILISVLGWILRFLRVYIVFIAIGAIVPISTLIIVETAVLAISFIPLLPGAIGTWEGSSIGLFILFGIDGATATAVTLIDRVFFYVFPSITGIIVTLYYIYHGIDLSQLGQ